MTDQNAKIIGDYKIEPGFFQRDCVVRKALGPWPLRNWSWVTFYYGTEDQCRGYIQWAERIHAGDKDLIKHASEWVGVQTGSGGAGPTSSHYIELLPKMWGYDFSQALALFPPSPESEVEVSAEAMLLVIAIIAALIVGFFYHSM